MGTEAASAELELVRAVVRRDRKATAEFVAAHSDAVYSFLIRRLAPRSEAAEDLMQEVFLAALEGMAQFKGDSGVRSWLIGIARHKVQDYYRDRLREEPFDESAEEPAGEPGFDKLLAGQQLAEKVREALDALPDAARVALLWRYWERCSAAEMARRTGKTEKAVERHLARAREQFRRRWRE